MSTIPCSWHFFGVWLSADRVAVLIDAKVIFAAVDLHIPVIGDMSVSSVPNPNSSLIVYKSFLSALRSLCHLLLVNDVVVFSVLDYLRLERLQPARRQACVLHLLLDFLW